MCPDEQYLKILSCEHAKIFVHDKNNFEDFQINTDKHG